MNYKIPNYILDYVMNIARKESRAPTAVITEILEKHFKQESMYDTETKRK